MEINLLSFLNTLSAYLTIGFFVISAFVPVYSAIRRLIIDKVYASTLFSIKVSFVTLLMATYCFSIFLSSFHKENFFVNFLFTFGVMFFIWLVFTWLNLKSAERVYGKGTIKRILRSKFNDKE